MCERWGDNCVQFGGMRLQIPADRHRLNYVKMKVQARRYADGGLSVYHGPLLPARYGPDEGLLDGRETGGEKNRAAA